jgi:glutamine cyclotransferase
VDCAFNGTVRATIEASSIEVMIRTDRVREIVLSFIAHLKSKWDARRKAQ